MLPVNIKCVPEKKNYIGWGEYVDIMPLVTLMGLGSKWEFMEYRLLFSQQSIHVVVL
jgi:hypothetical protein